MKETIVIGTSVTWKQYWNKDKTQAVVSNISCHNGKRVARLLFKDNPEVPFYVNVSDLKAVKN